MLNTRHFFIDFSLIETGFRRLLLNLFFGEAERRREEERRAAEAQLVLVNPKRANLHRYHGTGEEET